MASPYRHALSSAKKWGGKWEDYIAIHRFIDGTKLHLETWQHRAVLHNTFGIGICEQVFGDVIVNSDDKEVEVRYIAIRHIEEDCGYVPTIKEWLHDLPRKRFAINLIRDNKQQNNANNKDDKSEGALQGNNAGSERTISSY